MLLILLASRGAVIANEMMIDIRKNVKINVAILFNPEVMIRL